MILKKNLVFLGMMGSGKSSIGYLVSKKLNLVFNDIDSLIEEEYGVDISEIFKTKGEGYFTEKIFNALESGTIPIYWAISNPEPRILNPKSYCFADVEDKEKMKQSVNHAMENPGEYLSEPLFVPGAHKYVESLYTTLIDSLEILFIEKNIPITKITRKQSFPNYYLIIIVMVLIILIIYVCCNLTF